MNIILKTSLKNIFGKFGRTLLVTFSIFVCSICALLCFDLVSTIKEAITVMFGSITSGDIIALVEDYSVKGLPDGYPEVELMEINSNHDTLYEEIEGEYAFVTSKSLNIYGIDVEEAVNMGFMDQAEIGYMETIITYKIADEMGYREGDTFIIHDRANEVIELTVVGVLPQDSNNTLLTGYKILVNKETAGVISCGRGDTGVLFIDVVDDSKIDDALKMLEDYYPEGTIVRLALADEDMETVNTLAEVLYLVFAITFLLVIFVTASICNRIVSERMSFIGTLRSLGMSTARTGRILLLENVLYALFGSVPAVLLYLLFRAPFLNAMFYTADADGNRIAMPLPPLSVFLIFGVIIGAVVVECLIPLKAVIKALKTSIRDIIFDNRDTEYKYSKAGLVAGIILLAGALAAFFSGRSIFGATMCLLCGVVGLAFVFPWAFKRLAELIHNLAVKKGNAKWALASVEAMSRKSTVSSGVLCVTAAAMSVVIFTISQSAMAMFSGYDYSSDVIVACDDQMKNYSFIEKLEGVTDTEPLYESYMTIRINSEEKDKYGDFFAMPDGGFKYYQAFGQIPDSLEEGHILIDSKFADVIGINPGDVIKLTYDPYGVVPIEREYTVDALFDINSFDGSTGSFIITQQEYKELFRDMIGYYLIKCDDPEGVKDIIETYAVGKYISVYTLDEYIEQTDREAAQLNTIMMIIIAVAIGMTFIGMVSNQLLGFQGRKKECAVMLSTAMGKGKLSGILLREVLLTSITASCMGTLVGVFMTLVIGRAVQSVEGLFMIIKIDPVKCILFCLFLILFFTATVLFPIKSLRKMKISEQLKYE